MALVRRGLPQRPDEEQIADQRESKKPAGGPGPRTAAPMAASAPSFGGTAGSSGGQFGRFVSLGEYLGQNQPQAERMASKVGTGIAAEGAKSQLENKRIEGSYSNALRAGKTTARGISEFAPERYSAAQQAATSAGDKANALGTTGGIQTQVRQAYAQSPSTAGEALMDAALTQQAGGRGFAEIQSKYGNLQGMLSEANTRSAAAFDKAQADAAAREEERKRREEEEKRRLAEEERLRKQYEEEYKADDERFRNEVTANPPQQQEEYTAPEAGSSDEEAEKQFGRR